MTIKIRILVFLVFFLTHGRFFRPFYGNNNSVKLKLIEKVHYIMKYHIFERFEKGPIFGTYSSPSGSD